jgi:hypothetical protein
VAAWTRSARIAVVFVLALASAGCGAQGGPAASAIAVLATTTSTPSPTPTPTPRATPSSTPRPTATATLEPEPLATPTPSMRPLPNARRGKITLPEDGVTLTLPKGWESIGLDDGDIDAIYDRVPPGILPDNMRDQVRQLMGAGLKLWAFDLRPLHRGANVSVVSTTPLPLDTLETSARYSTTLVEGLTLDGVTRPTIDGQPCVRVDLSLSMSVGGAPLGLRETQLYITRPHSTVVVTIAMPKAGSLGDRDAIIKSIHLND